MLTKRFTTAALFIGISFLFFGALTVRADITQTERDTSYTLSFSDSFFNNADVLYQNNISTSFTGSGATTVDDVLNFLFTPDPGSVVISGNAFVSAGGPPPAAETLTAGAGGFGFGYSSSASNTPGSSFLLNGVSPGGLATLELSANPAGFLDLNGLFTLVVFIPGNFSTQGTDTGDVTLNHLNPKFTIVEDFVYNSGIDATVFSASFANDDGTPPALDFTLYGSPVPEPGVISLLFVGVIAVAVGRRKFQRA